MVTLKKFPAGFGSTHYYSQLPRRQEDGKFKLLLGHLVRFYLKTKSERKAGLGTVMSFNLSTADPGGTDLCNYCNCFHSQLVCDIEFTH